MISSDWAKLCITGISFWILSFNKHKTEHGWSLKQVLEGLTCQCNYQHYRSKGINEINTMNDENIYHNYSKLSFSFVSSKNVRLTRREWDVLLYIVIPMWLVTLAGINLMKVFSLFLLKNSTLCNKWSRLYKCVVDCTFSTTWSIINKEKCKCNFNTAIKLFDNFHNPQYKQFVVMETRSTTFYYLKQTPMGAVRELNCIRNTLHFTHVRKSNNFRVNRSPSMLFPCKVVENSKGYINMYICSPWTICIFASIST